MTTLTDQSSPPISLNVIILAAGDSTRMQSDTPKVLHPLGGRPLIEYSVRLADELAQTPPVVVIGRGAQAVRDQLGARARYVEQQQRLGTGHAVMQARDLLAGQPGVVAVFYGDMPLLTVVTMQRLLRLHADGNSVLSMLTFESATPRGFGRIVRAANGDVQAIVEEVDCTPEQRLISELNPGLYCFEASWLWQNIDAIPVSRKGEYYLTDLVGIAVSQGRRVAAVKVDDATEMLGINTREHLAEAEAVLRGRINRRHMQAGVTLIDPHTTYIDDTVSIGRDTVVFPATHLRGATNVGQGCRIGPDSTIENTSLGNNCRVTYSVLEDAVVEDGVEIGPFAHLRRGAHLGQRRPHGQLRRGEELVPWAGRQDGPLQLYRRCTDRQRDEYRRRHGHLQLRRQSETPYRDRRRRIHRQRHDAGGAGAYRRRRAHRRRFGRDARRAGRRDSGWHSGPCA